MAGLFNGDASDFYRLADDFTKIGATSLPVVQVAMNKGGETLRDQWKQNATATAGVHGKWYPSAIASRPLLGISTVGVEVGPDLLGHQKQGGMSFEFGSVNQPAHLDGLHALDSVEGKVQADFTAAVGHLFA